MGRKLTNYEVVITWACWICSIAALVFSRSFIQTSAIDLSLLLLSVGVTTVLLLLVTKRPVYLALTSLFFSAFAIEVFFLTSYDLRDKSGDSVVYDFQGNGFQKDPYIKYWGFANGDSLASKWVNRQPIYLHVHYHLDSIGRRSCSDEKITKHSDLSLPRIDLFGCSFTFGEGLSAKDTVACRIEKDFPSFQVSNYAQLGYGLTEPYFLVTNDNYFEKSDRVENTCTIGMYLFIEDHIWRTVGTFQRFLESPITQQSWFLRLNASGVIEPWKPIEELSTHPLLGLILWGNQHSSFGRWLSSRLAIPFVSNEEAIEISFAAVMKLQERYQLRYPHATFVVATWPQSQGELQTRLLEKLSRAGIPTLSVTSQLHKDQQSLHPLDAHPSVDSNKEFADLLEGALSPCLTRCLKDPLSVNMNNCLSQQFLKLEAK